MRKALLTSLVVVGLALSVNSARADESYEKMDSETTSLVIEKLENALKKSGASDDEAGSLQLRLGDLYAERARLRFMEDTEKGITDSKSAREDRQKALTFYEKALPFAPADVRGGLLLQMAHLNVSLNRLKQAEQYYTTLINEGSRSHGSKVYGQGLSSYADYLYRQQKFSQAKEYYIRALANSGTPQKGFVKYNYAWCLLNLGHDLLAQKQLIEVLKSQKLLDLDQNGEPDSSFHQDVVKDLASFLGKSKIDKEGYALISKLSPANKRLDNLIFLAEESERLGMKSSAVIVWNLLFKENELSGNQKLQGQISLIQIWMDLEKKNMAAMQSEVVSKSFQKGLCTQEACEGLRVKFRNAVISWSKIDKKNPNEDLLKAYVAYSNAFSSDFEMHQWAAQVARDLKKFAVAYQMYMKATDASHGPATKNDEKAKKIFEGSLLGSIEMAEASNNLEFKLKSYQRYLDLNPRGQKASMVSYQKAHTLSLMKRFDESTVQFREIALHKTDLEESVRIQAADLALDGLAAQKRDADVELWATEFSQMFKSKSAEYAALARTSALNQSAVTIKSDKASQYELMLLKLKKTDVKSASYDEKIRIFKNRVILAERLKNLKEVERSAQECLQISQIKADDREWALSKLAWTSEMNFDFKAAYKITNSMKNANLSAADLQLKLGLLADLAKLDSQEHFRKFIQLSKNTEKSNLVRAELIRKSSRPNQAFEKEWQSMLGSPQILSDLNLELFSKYGPSAVTEKVIKNPKLKAKPSSMFLAKIMFIREFQKFSGKLNQHKLSSANEAVLNRSLQERMNLIVQAENWATQAVASRDWSLQLLTLAQVSLAHQKMSDQVSQLPSPRGLNSQQKAEYKKLLAVKSQEFKAKAHQIEEKLKELWRSESILEAMAENYRTSAPDVQSLIEEEIVTLQKVAPSYMSARLGRVLKFKTEKPTRNEIMVARRDVKEDPFNVRRAQNLKKLEEQAGSSSMAGIMDIRIHQLKGAQL